MFVALFWRVVAILAPLQRPLLTGAIVDALTRKPVTLYGLHWGSGQSLEIVEAAALGLVILALVRSASSYLRQTSGAILSRSFVFDLRKRLIRKINLLSLDKHQELGAGELIDRTLRDTNTARQFLNQVFLRTLTNILRAGYPVVMLFMIDPIMAGATLSVLIPQWALTHFLARRLHKMIRQNRRRRSRLMNSVKENIDGIETIKTLNAGSNVINRLGRMIDRLEVELFKVSKISALIGSNVWLTTGIGLGIAWWLGGLKVLSGEMTLGTLVVFSGYLSLVYRPLRRFTNIIKSYRRGLVSLERIQELLDMPLSVEDRENARELTVRAGEVEFNNVSFGYGSGLALHNINCRIQAGSFTALAGKSGSGKSSLLRLITRLYDPDAGEVLIDGQALRAVTLESLRSQISVVPQRPVIFTGTVWENITLAMPDASREVVMAACRGAGLMAFIQQLPKGFKTRIGAGGAHMSGGEAQRLAIARALLSRPAILLLDEPTSALDPETEDGIIQSLLKLRGEITVIMAAHRLGVICQADSVIVMDAGRVVLQDSPAALVKNSRHFQNLFGLNILNAAS